MAQKRKINILKRAKGFRHGGSKKIAQAHERLMRAGRYAFAHRRDKKTDFRKLWIVRLNAAVRALPVQAGAKPLSYSAFIAKLKKTGFELDRKVLSTFASEHPEIFDRIAKQVI